MLVSLSISFWTARKFDKKESKKFTASHQVSDNAARINKSLLPDESGAHKALVASHSAARLEHYRLTLPWSDAGSRILLASNYEKYTEAMRPLRMAFDTASKTFIGEYPHLYEVSKGSLKTLWKEEDYPTVSEIPNKFSFSIKVLPLPQAGDFRVNLGAGDVEAIQDQIREDTKVSITLAMRDPYERLLKVVKAMAIKLHDRKGKFHDSLITNIEDLVGLLPALNLTNDLELTKMGERISGNLMAHEPETLRINKKARKQTAEQADQIYNDLAAFMAR